MKNRDPNNPKSIVGAIAVMVLVPMFFLVLPIYVGALADDFGFTSAQIGYLVSIELGGAALASLSALFWLRRTDWRKATLILLFVLATANWMCIGAGGDYDVLYRIRAVAGLAAGALMAIALAALGDTRDQDRNFGFGVAGQLGISGCLLLVSPYFVVRWGADSVFAIFLLACFIAIPLSRWLPSCGTSSETARLTERRSLLPLWGLAGSAAVFVAQSAVWAFIERMGSAGGLSAEFIGIALGSSVLAGMAGAFAASWLAAGKGRLVPMAMAMAGEVISLMFLFGSFTPMVYLAVVIVYSVCWNFWLPYQMAVIADTDISGRFVALITLSQAVGVAVGPALAASYIGERDFSPVLWTGIGFAVIALILFLPVTVGSDNRTAGIGGKAG